MKYQVQFDATEPDKWQTVNACSSDAAMFIAIRPLIKKGLNPKTAYVGCGQTHGNGAPICVLAKELTIVRDGARQQ